MPKVLTVARLKEIAAEIRAKRKPPKVEPVALSPIVNAPQPTTVNLYIGELTVRANSTSLHVEALTQTIDVRPEITVSPQVVEVHPFDVNVTVPQLAAPDVVVNVPQQPAPNVTIEAPSIAAPEIKNIVKIPETQITVEQPAITVEQPIRPKRKIIFDHDAQGNITKATEVEG